MKLMGRTFILCYRTVTRVQCKVFSLLVSGAFARFGKKSSLMYPVRLSGERRIAIGDGVSIGPGSWLQTLSDGENRSVALEIGSGASIAGACVFSAIRRVALEKDVLLARNVYISDHIHRYTQIGVPILEQGVDKVMPVLIREGAWLGQNVVVCPGVTIGRGAVIGANSVVTHDIPDFCVAAGAPARVLKSIEAGCREPLERARVSDAIMLKEGRL
jgi:acetyltransferase-like isoleucine patch superfamily enzyme